MHGSRSKKVVGSTIILLTLVSCAAVNKAKDSANDATGGALGAKCPDLTHPESILQADFAGTFKLDAAVATKLKAATAASVEVKGFSDQIDADLIKGCGGMAKDLGVAGDFKDGKSACDAALKAITDTKAKLGANAKIALVTVPPRCEVKIDAYADCGAKCDVNVKPGSAEIKCEPGKLSGKCDAECSGTCDVTAAAKCDGTCNGTCDVAVQGATCSGTCNGKCDGKDSKAACGGKCDGKCEGGSIKGECKGKCGGTCELKAKAKCEGTCSGDCSVKFKEPKCSGEMTPPQMSADCKAHCDTQMSTKAECTPAKVGVAITGAADAKAAAALKTAFENNLGLILKVAIGIGKNGIKVAGNVTTVVDGAQATVKDLVAKGGVSAASTTGQLGVCLADTFSGAIKAAGSIQANVNVSASVSASASGSAGGGGAAKP